MKVKCIKRYNDALLNKTIEVNEELYVDEDRAKYLISHNVVEKVIEEKIQFKRPKKEIGE